MQQVSNATVSSRPTNAMSGFTATDIKPALGIDFTYFADITLLLQSTGKVFGEIDEGERDRQFGAPGLRGLVEVLKSRVGVSLDLSALCALTCIDLRQESSRRIADST